jgi:hypothetical protein
MRRRWSRSKGRVPRKKRIQLLLQGVYHSQVALPHIVSPLIFVFSYCRLNRKGFVATQGDGDDGDVCVAVSEEALFSIHGLDATLPVLCDFCPRKFNDFTKFDAHMVTHK